MMFVLSVSIPRRAAAQAVPYARTFEKSKDEVDKGLKELQAYAGEKLPIVDGFVSAGPAVNLKPHTRRAFIAAYERRLDQEVTHPVFGYRVSMRRLLEVQARLLARHLAGEIADYPHYLVR